MLNDSKYDKIKLLHELSCITWFIKNHAESDAQEHNDAKMTEFLKKLSNNLENHIKELEALI